MLALLDSLSVTGCFVVMFWAVPFFGPRLGADRAVRWQDDFVPAWIRGFLFFEIVSITLGSWKLSFGGALGLVTLAWIAVMWTFASSRRWTLTADGWKTMTVRLLLWVERRAWRQSCARFALEFRRVAWRREHLLWAALPLGALAARIQFPLANFRFLELETYGRAISLQELVNGAGWTPDGSVAFLAPLAHFSGSDAAAVIRWSGALLSLGLLGSIAFCAYRWTRRASAAYLAPFLFELYVRWVSEPAGDPGTGEIAAMFWILALAMLRTSRSYALACAALALMVLQAVPVELVPALAAIPASAALCWAAAVVPAVVRTRARAAVVVFSWAILYGSQMVPETREPVQYEAAAKAVASIVNEYPRNSYFIVSPTQELASVYGRGWHYELGDFVRQFDESDVSRAEFRFPFATSNLFVFVEKTPLPQPEIPPAAAADVNSYYYYTLTGRLSLEFKAARLMDRYLRAHSNSQVYYEDGEVIVYQVSQHDADSPPTPLTTASAQSKDRL